MKRIEETLLRVLPEAKIIEPYKTWGNDAFLVFEYCGRKYQIYAGWYRGLFLNTQIKKNNGETYFTEEGYVLSHSDCGSDMPTFAERLYNYFERKAFTMPYHEWKPVKFLDWKKEFSIKEDFCDIDGCEEYYCAVTFKGEKTTYRCEKHMEK